MTVPPPDGLHRYNGNLSFYKYCSLELNPRYLQRNLSAVLKDLERERLRLQPIGHRSSMNKKAPGFAAGTNGGAQHGPARSQTARTWTYLEIESIIRREPIDHIEPALVINVTDLTDRLAKFRNQSVSKEPASKKIRQPTTKAFCTLTIWHPKLKNGNLVELEKKCELIPKTLPNGERGASINLEEPFTIPVSQFRPRAGESMNDIREDPYSMQIMLSAANESDQWPPIDPHVHPPKQATSWADNRLTRFPVFVAKWKRLPQIPETNQESLLELHAIQDGVGYKPKLSMKVEITWTQGTSTLEQANVEFNRTAKHANARVHPELNGEAKYLDWKFRDDSGSSRRSQRCPENHCAMCYRQDREGVRRLKSFPSLERLLFHIRNDHPLFKVWYSPTAGPGLVGEIVVTTSSDYDPVRTQDPDMRAMDWIRPKEPFDMKTYLDGDESWVGRKPKRSNGSALPRSRQESSTPRTPQERIKHVVPTAARPRAPKDVPNVVRRVRRTFKVPKAPDGVKFYRQPSMRPVEEGEMLSETDEDVGEEWLLQKHADNIDSFSDITATEKELIKLFDRHMAGENFASDLHAGEALYRFCRQNRKILQQHDMYLDFNALLMARKEDGSIGLEHIHHCNMIINFPGTSDEMDVEKEGGSEANATAANYGDVPPEGAHSCGRCAICREIIYDSTTSVCCTGLVSSSPISLALHFAYPAGRSSTAAKRGTTSLASISTAAPPTGSARPASRTPAAGLRPSLRPAASTSPTTRWTCRTTPPPRFPRSPQDTEARPRRRSWRARPRLCGGLHRRPRLSSRGALPSQKTVLPDRCRACTSPHRAPPARRRPPLWPRAM